MKVMVAFLAALSVSLLWFFRDRCSVELEPPQAITSTTPNPESGDQPTILADAPFAQKFGNEELSIHEELELIQLAFQDYLSFVKKRYRRPIGDNLDFVEAMTGKNSFRIAPIPPNHSRINDRGELTDRMGIPFAIHPLAEDAIEVRAVGEDGLLWTDDDVVNLTPKGRDLKQKLNER